MDLQWWVNSLDPDSLCGLSTDQLRVLLKDFVAAAGGENDVEKLQEIFGIGALHPDPLVRRATLDIAEEHIDHDAAAELICWATHDTDDFICFRAVKLCKKYALESSIQDLVSIIGRPSERTDSGQLPVGMGHAHVLDALLHLLGTDDPSKLRITEDFFFLNGRLPSADITLERRIPSLEGMVYVPPGNFVEGIDREEVPFKRFDTSYYSPATVTRLEGFYIDEYPVTNAEYDEFVKDIERNGHRYCQPDEPTNKVHRRNTFLDPRFEPSHPATGIDWYDACAYARWKGKDLPTEAQWEKAARGTDGRVYPWGNEFAPAALNWLGETFGKDIRDIHEWRKLLVQINETFPRQTTTAVDAHPENKSPYGVYDMVGNAWEYTKNNFFSNEEMEPDFKDKDPVSFMQNPEAFVLIKGGPWTGIPELTSAVFRGKDLFTDRHNEIGFRCVVNTEPH